MDPITNAASEKFNVSVAKNIKNEKKTVVIMHPDTQEKSTSGHRKGNLLLLSELQVLKEDFQHEYVQVSYEERKRKGECFCFTRPANMVLV